MSNAEVLVLHGSPGSGKTTLSRAVAELLGAARMAHAVIDLDQLSLIFPSPGRSFACDNLAAVWPNYAAVPGIKVIVAGVVADGQDRDRLRAAVPGARFTVCELTAPEAVLKDRVTAREPTESLRRGLRTWVDVYHRRTDLALVRDFQVATHDRTVQEAAREILAKAGWG